MEYCPHCGKPNETDGSFCPHCGKTSKKKSLSRKTLIPITGILAVMAVALLLFVRFGSGFPEIVDKASASAVTVSTYDVNGININTGSGYAAFEKGIIVTDFHTITNDAYRIEITTQSGDIYAADSIVCFDRTTDIAIVRVPECTIKPLNSGSFASQKDSTLSFDAAQNLYDHRSAAQEMSVEQYWSKNEHTYAPSYVLNHANTLAGKPIALSGYVSAVHWDIYLVDTADQALGLEITNSDSEASRESKESKIYAQYSGDLSLHCQMDDYSRFNTRMKPGNKVTLNGSVMVFPENNAGPDIRFLVSEIVSPE